MPAPGTLAVEATQEKYFVLKHMPGGLALDQQGKGEWPADQFTFRLIQEGALREQAATAVEPDQVQAAVLRAEIEEEQAELAALEHASPAESTQS